MSNLKSNKSAIEYFLKIRNKPSADMAKSLKKIQKMTLEEAELSLKKTKEELSSLDNKLRSYLMKLPKETLAEMLIILRHSWTDASIEKYKIRNRGKDSRMKNREPYEKLAEEVYKEMLSNKEKVTLNTLTYHLMNKHKDIRWQNNSDPDLSEKKLKDVVKLKAIYSKLRKKYVR